MVIQILNKLCHDCHSLFPINMKIRHMDEMRWAIAFVEKRKRAKRKELKAGESAKRIHGIMRNLCPLTTHLYIKCGLNCLVASKYLSVFNFLVGLGHLCLMLMYLPRCFTMKLVRYISFH
jgi:hypothetical protein